MSKREKLEARLRREPASTDFAWDDLITIMESYRFVVTCKGGSHHTFQHPNGLTVKISKTHPSGVLKRYQIKAAIEAIDSIRQDTQ